MGKIRNDEVFALRQDGWTLSQLAERYGCTKTAVSHYLSRSRVRVNQARPLRPCACGCGVLHKRRKYATPECYLRHVMAQVATAPYAEWRQGQRIARAVVRAAGFTLQPGHVVHHADRDTRHNDVANLWVFASHADHMSFHRGGLARPIWRGDGLALDS